MSKLFEIAIKNSAVGTLLPFSHRETVSCDTDKISPIRCCDNPLSTLISLILFPILCISI